VEILLISVGAEICFIGDFGGLYNAPSYPNSSAFATLQTDGSITAWGDSDSGGLGAPVILVSGCIYSSTI
jgi:hypothetical protein